MGKCYIMQRDFCKAIDDEFESFSFSNLRISATAKPPLWQALSTATPSEVREFLELLLSLDLYSQPAGKDHVQTLLDAVAKRAGQQDNIDVSQPMVPQCVL